MAGCCIIIKQKPPWQMCFVGVWQIPLGVLADRVGGPRVMLASLAAWCAVTGATPLVQAVPRRSLLLPALLAARAAQGLAQSCIMPATSAMAAR
jgi:MFS family permease